MTSKQPIREDILLHLECKKKKCCKKFKKKGVFCKKCPRIPDVD